MKKKIIISIISIIILLLLAFFYFKLPSKNNNEILKTKYKKIAKKISLSKKELKKYEIENIDTEAPTISYEKEITIYEGDEINLLEYISANDNIDTNMKIDIEGEYDTNSIGSYNLKYVVSDSSNNTTEGEFTLKVIKKTIDSNTSNNNTKSNSDGTFTTSKGFSGIVKDGITYINGTLIANKSYSLPDWYNPGGLTGETQEAFNEMKSAAANEGINLWIVSGFRSYWDQNSIYNNYVARDGKANADTYSARPGHSEHQTGLAFDLNWIDEAFEYAPEGKWLNDNAYKYGFILRYPKGKTYETGYIFEPWHYRYVGVDLSTKLFNNGDWITIENYFGINSQYN